MSRGRWFRERRDRDRERREREEQERGAAQSERLDTLMARGGPLGKRLEIAVEELMTAMDSEDEHEIAYWQQEAYEAQEALLAQADETGEAERWPWPMHLVTTTRPVPLNSEINPERSLSTPPPPFRSSESGHDPDYDPFTMGGPDGS